MPRRLHFSELVGCIYDAALDASRWGSALKNLAHVLGARSACLLTFDGRRHLLDTVQWGFDEAALSSYNQHFGRIDPVLPKIVSAPVGTIKRAFSIIPASALKSTEFFNDWARPNKVADSIFDLLSQGSGLCVTLCLASDLGDERFGSDDCSRLLHRLHEHLRRAVRISITMESARMFSGSAREVFECLPLGIVLLNDRMRLVYANTTAEELVREEDGIRWGLGATLHATFESDEGQLQKALQRALREDESGSTLGSTCVVQRMRQSLPLTLHIIPIMLEEGFQVGRCALVLFVDPCRDRNVRSSSLELMYGLTRAEAIVAERVAKGRVLQHVADDLEISLSTVRTHLQRVFEKTHTSRQTELIRLLLDAELLTPAAKRDDQPAPRRSR